ncbi:MAG TPA: transposase [Blastocatellia bacterium]|nr:transposase [Blastocatellia bacterium]
MSERQQKALVIAAKNKIVKKGDTWLVPSQSGNGSYKVNNTDPDWPTCTCPDFELRRTHCKHIYAVEIVVERERRITETIDGDTTTTTVTETVKVTKRVTYKQQWPAYNAAQTNEKHLFESLLHDLCGGIVEPTQKMGRPRLQYKDMIFAAAYKVYCGMSARRFNTDFCEAQIKGHVSKSAHFNSVNRYLANPALTPLLRELIAYSSLPLKAIETDFAVDSSGFSTCQYVRWFDTKYGKKVDAHDWIKVHLMTGVKTHIVTSVEITGRYEHDSPQLAALVKQTADNFTVKEVSGDKGYSSLESHELIAAVGATPYIAFKGNATGGIGGLFQKMFHFYTYKRDEFLAAYHKRSNVETTFSMVKAKFGGSLRSKSQTGQTNEALCKILCHNLCCVIQSMFEFGVEPTFGSEIALEPNVH